MAIIMPKLASLVPTMDLILASLMTKQSCSVCIAQGKKGQGSFLNLHEDWSTNIKKRKVVSFGALWSFIFCPLTDQRVSFPAWTKSCLHKCQLTFKDSLVLQAAGFICRARFKKGDIKWAGPNAASKIKFKKGQVFTGIIYTQPQTQMHP